MKKVTIHKAIIRFRRWSRTRYAMFNSLGRCVTIGYLKKGVADASLKKQKPSAPVTLPQPTGDSGKERNETEEDISGILFQSYCLLFQPQVPDEACITELTESTIPGNKLSRIGTPVSVRLFIYR